MASADSSARLKKGFDFLGRLSHEVGWQYQGVIAKLEEKRKVRSAAFYEQKKAELKLREKASGNVAKKVAKYDEILKQDFGSSSGFRLNPCYWYR
uniref:60S ribosomal protein L13a n=1 Tax=Bursaphelenchus xylophilus TaxID=6326 RepID=A0A1I7SMM9_BURXY